MYSHWRFFLRPTQDNVLFFGEWEYPLPWLRRERLRPGNHWHHIWMFHMEGKDWFRQWIFTTGLCCQNMFNNLKYTSPLLSSTSPKRTEAMRVHVLVFPAGQWEITTTIRPLTCGYIVPTVATCTMEESWSARFRPSPRVTPSPASWTWRLTPYHLLRMTRSDLIFTVNI